MERKGMEASRPVPRVMRGSALRDLMPWHWRNRRGEPVVDDPFESLQNAMNRLLDTFRREIGGFAGNGDVGVVSSKMDVAETDEAFEVTVELPGMNEKDVDVSVTADALTVRGEKKTETATKKKDYHYRECSYGSVERVVPLPEGLDIDKAAAKFRNGVLTVTLPKTAEAKKAAKKVEVEVAA